MKHYIKLILFSILLISTLESNTNVSLQLAWKNQFQFAGYYIAKEKGFYSNVGLDVNIKEYDNDVRITDDIISGKSDFGVGRSSLIYDRYNNKPVVMLGAIFQHSPVILLTRKRDDIVNIEDLKNKKVMFTTDQVAMASINAMLQSRQISSNMYTSQAHSFNVQDLIDGKTDVMLSYISNEPYAMKKQNIAYKTFSPKDYNFDFYSDILFTSQSLLKKSPKVVKDFRAASLKGWEYAINNQKETVELILKKYNSQARTKEALLYEAAAIKKLINKDKVELGNIDPKRIEFITQIYTLMGLIKNHKSIDNLVYKVDKSDIDFTEEEQKWLASHKSITVANETDYAPWDFTMDSKPAGYSIDYIKLLAKKTGLKLNFITDKWENLVRKTQSNEIDLIHTMYKNKTHQDLLYIAPYKKVVIGIYTHEKNNDIHKIGDLSQKTVSLPKGDSTIQGVQKTVGDLNVKLTDGYIQTLKDIAFSKADATVMDMAVANYLIKQNTLPNIKIVAEAHIDEKLLHNQYYLAVNKSSPILASILKKAMDSVTDEEEKIISNRWISGLKTKDSSKSVDLELNKDEKAWIKAHPVVKFTGDPAWLPFEAFNKDGKYIGIISEYLDKLEGLTGVEFKKVPVNSWNESLELSRTKKVDVLSETTESFRDGLIFTKPYIINDIIIVMDKEHNYVDGLEAIKHKRVALVKDYGYAKQIEDKFSYIDFIEVDSIENGLRAVSTGKVDALVCTFALGTYTTTKMGLSNIKVVGKTRFNTSLGLGVREDYAPFVSILNKAIDTISQQEHNEIFNHWIKQDYVEKVNYALLYKVGGGAFILLLMFIIWNRKMAKEISKRKEIEQKLQDSSARMSTLFDASPDSISILDADGNYVDCNEATLRMFGLASKEKFLQLKPYSLSPELQYNKQPSLELALKEIAVAFEKGINKFQWQHKRVDTEELFDAEVLLSLVSLDNKPYIYGVVRDITQTMRVQKELDEIQDKQRLTIENKVKELTLKQTKQLEEIERSNVLLSGRENKMVELKSEINEYALKLGIEKPYIIVDEVEINLAISTQEIEKEIDIETLLDIPKLQLLMEDFHRFMNIPLAIIDLKGNVLVQSKWSRACTDFHRVHEESCKKCIESDIDISHKLDEGQDFSVYKCSNGLIDCAAPIVINGKHLANFFIGQFVTEEPDIEFFTNQAKFFGYDVDDYISAIKDAVIVSEDRLPHILGFLKEITEIISTLSNEKLNFKQQEKNMNMANIASMNLAEDAQKATREIETYKNHLEDLVNERTDELNNQKKFVQTLLDSQEQLIITTNGKTMTSFNQTFADFYNIKGIEEFKANYGADCICETFNTKAPEGYMQIKMDDEYWIDYIINRSDSSYTHKAIITKDGVDYIFSVSATILPGEDELKSAVFTNITEMENAKQEVERVHKHTRDSIEYAALIQSALIPNNEIFKNYFDDYFAIWQPKDIVGGDIYLFEELRDKDECLFMVIDCTGHGVPGAFVTMLVKAIERQITSKINYSKEDVSPAKILSIFNNNMKQLLKQENIDSISNAGFDGGVIYYNKKDKILKFAGAETPLFYVEDDELKVIKGSRYSVGYKKCDAAYEYKEHQIEVKKGMSFYLTTDGYFDQNGGEKSFPLGKKRFQNIIKKHHKESFSNQQEFLLRDLKKYQGNEERNDDVTLIGFKI